ncbi:MAG TPA: hypothetical protein VK501_27745 [Baekduia sp.]|uniref:hypothetical protein n=1 Tax=Baekduia sp. TaxID=2600305 RepID=UPI002C8D064C|nr:hypothetical protein [Baekduia sp.]HMJ37732.1 hypothetical protein [Baekduia sp.]
MQHREDPSPAGVAHPDAQHASLHAGSDAVGLAPHVGDHHFCHPNVAPVSRPVPAATRQW